MLDNEVELSSFNIFSDMPPKSKREFLERLTVILEYGREKTVPYQWTRKAYEDLTSMGTPFTEPAQVMHDVRPMNDLELAQAVHDVVSAFTVVKGNVRQMLYDIPSHCFEKRSSKDFRCMHCKGCENYKSVINKIMSKEDTHDKIQT